MVAPLPFETWYWREKRCMQQKRKDSSKSCTRFLKIASAFYKRIIAPMVNAYEWLNAASRVDYGRRAASRPSVSRSLSPNRTYMFPYVSGSPKTTAYLSYTAEHVSRHVGDKTYRSLPCVHREFPRRQNTSVFCPPSPRGRLSRLQTTTRAPSRIRPSPVSTDSLQYRQTRCGSHVPVLNPWMVRCLLYPWRPWRTG